MGRPRNPPKENAANAGGQARTVLRDAVNKKITPENIEALLDKALNAEATAIVHCPHCSESFKAELPDVKKAVDTLTALIQEAEGRPEQRQPEATRIIIQRPPLLTAVPGR